MAAYECRVQSPWFEHVRDGTKTAEGRLCKGVFARIEAGDRLLVNRADDPLESFQAVVKRVTRYASFGAALEKELAAMLPGIDSVEEGVAVYRGFYSEEQERAHGVVVVELSGAPLLS